MRSWGHWSGWLLGGALVWVASGCAHGPGSATLQPEDSGEQRTALVSWEEFDADWLAEAVFVETNRVRRTAGLPPFRKYPRLQQAAELQAATNAMLGHPSHDNPLLRRRDVMERVVAAGIQPSQVGENVAMTPVRPVGSSGPVAADPPWPNYGELAGRIVQQWFDSPPHRSALLSVTFTHLACGVQLARGPLGGEVIYAVQVFLVPRRGQVRTPS